MNRIQRIIIGALLAVTALVLLLSAFNPRFLERKQKPSDITIQVILRSNESEYWQNVALGAQAAVKEFGITMYITAAYEEDDAEGQMQAAMKSLLTKPDAIVLGASDDEAFAPFLKAAADQHIPVIAIDSVLTSGKTKSYIGMDNYAAGQEALDELAKQLKGQGDIAIVAHAEGGINGKLREQGIVDAMVNHPGINLVDRVFCSGDRDQCSEAVGQALHKQPLDGIISLNTKSSLGAAVELKKKHAGERVKLIGFDSSPELLEMLQENQLQKLIVQNPFSMGYLGIKYAVDAALGHKVPPRVEMRSMLIDKQNMFWKDNQKLLFPVVQ
ncbi:substrate-binding domain-containing protein [Paenibacillus glycanilyticus]|uniref:substrate-binding domain-containing protein n=1 Tax=Paenibacillus glycanilyticus TaxID=126569 RepID=UPI00203BE277|nr:substrate-binding domain-containing protein [Paenibacillus glycanilyticus]MCM3630173.1 substrate-binding domain-containing protein [Paenibacillus glycanilyticus]